MPLSKDGKVIKVHGVQIRVYPIATLAEKLSEALGSERTTQTVRKWEKKGVTPPALFRVAGKRMYSMEQIKCICKVAKEEDIKQGCSVSMAKFSNRVIEELKQINSDFVERAKKGQVPKKRKDDKK